MFECNGGGGGGRWDGTNTGGGSRTEYRVMSKT